MYDENSAFIMKPVCFSTYKFLLPIVDISLVIYPYILVVFQVKVFLNYSNPIFILMIFLYSFYFL